MGKDVPGNCSLALLLTSTGSAGKSLSFSGLQFSRAEDDRNHPAEVKCQSDLRRIGKRAMCHSLAGKRKLHGLIVSPPGKWAE